MKVEFLPLPPSVWDDTAINILTLMHANGSSAGVISRALMSEGYRFSRNAVIGKKNRMKLKPPPPDVMRTVIKSPKPPRTQAKRAAARVFIMRKSMAAPMMEDQAMTENKAPSRNPVPLLESRDGQCKAIIGYENGELGRTIYCGDPTPIKYIKGRISHNSWCHYHHGRYTQPDRPRR